MQKIGKLATGDPPGAELDRDCGIAIVLVALDDWSASAVSTRYTASCFRNRCRIHWRDARCPANAGIVRKANQGAIA